MLRLQTPPAHDTCMTQLAKSPQSDRKLSPISVAGSAVVTETCDWFFTLCRTAVPILVIRTKFEILNYWVLCKLQFVKPLAALYENIVKGHAKKRKSATIIMFTTQSSEWFGLVSQFWIDKTESIVQWLVARQKLKVIQHSSLSSSAWQAVRQKLCIVKTYFLPFDFTWLRQN